MTARIILAVREKEYIEPVLRYCRSGECREKLQVVAFSRMDTFEAHIEGNEVPDALIGDPAFIEAWLLKGKASIPWATLGERNGNGPDGGLHGGAIAKFQALPCLVSAMLQLSGGERSDRAPLGEGTVLTGIVSGSGGSGKTVLALNMAKVLGERGHSVFYLNLESVDSRPGFMRSAFGAGPALDELLYELQSRPDSGESGAGLLGRYVIRCEELKAYVFRPAHNMRELLHMSKRNTLELLRLLKTCGGYDVIIADTGGLEDERTQAVLEEAGELLWLRRNDGVCQWKEESWLSHLDSPHAGLLHGGIRKRSRAVSNFCTQPENGVPDGDDRLPFIASWALPQRTGLYLESPAYRKAVRELCGEAKTEQGGRMFSGGFPE